MKYLLLLLMLQVTSIALGQSIDVTPTGSSAGNDAQTFSMDRGDLTVRGRQVTVHGASGQTGISSALAHDLSGNISYLGVIHTDNDLRASIVGAAGEELVGLDRKSTRLNSSHVAISYAVFCLSKKDT